MPLNMLVSVPQMHQLVDCCSVQKLLKRCNLFLRGVAVIEATLCFLAGLP